MHPLAKPQTKSSNKLSEESYTAKSSQMGKLQVIYWLRFSKVCKEWVDIMIISIHASVFCITNPWSSTDCECHAKLGSGTSEPYQVNLHIKIVKIAI